MPSKQRIAVVIALQALASLMMLSPILWLNLPAFVGNSDALFYTIVLKLMAGHMAAGDWLAHWLPEANGGAGSPVMLYYSPLAYTITAIIGAPLSAFDPLGWKRLLLGMFFAQLVAGVGAYIWLRRRVSEKSALMASLLFTVFPYKFVYIFLHINLAQLWAIAWLPPLMMAAEDMAAEKPKAPAWYGLWLALLALTHPRTLVAFAALPALYVLLFAPRRSRALLSLLAAHALGAALSAYYWLPALLNLGLVDASAANLGRMYYASNLSHQDIMLNFHYAVIAALVIGLMARLPDLRASHAGKKAWFYIAAIVATALLCLKISKPLWDALPPLQFLQFPAARLHVVALIAATALAALFFERAASARSALYSPVALLLPVAVMAAVTLRHINKLYATATGISWSYIEDMHHKNIILPPEYHLRQPAAGIPHYIGENAGLAVSALALLLLFYWLRSCKGRMASLPFRP